MNKARGYTLIEIMVVLIIIGIVATMAMFAVGDFGQSKKIKAAAVQIKTLISLAEQQAMLQPAVLGLSVSDSGYRFYQLMQDASTHVEHWQLINRDAVLRPHNFPAGTMVKLTVPGLQNENANKPQIVISPSGDISAFTLDISKDGKGTHHIISGKFNGEVELHHEAS